MPSDESDLWKQILKIPLVKEKILEQGYYSCTRSFREMTSTFGAQMKLRAPEYLSKDFWSRQPTFLVERGYYVLRTGIGKFALLNEKVFPRPYLSLQTTFAKELKLNIPQRYDQIKRAFEESAQENAALEQMRFLGIFEQLITDLFGTREYLVGPRGNRSSSFEIFIQNKNHEKIKLCTYRGQEELDYSLWTEDSVLLFEAKQTNKSTGFLDLGWHKLVYPANRFRNYKASLYPTYFLRRKNVVHIFVFPRIQFYRSGITLNDAQAMTPQKIYRIHI